MKKNILFLCTLLALFSSCKTAPSNNQRVLTAYMDTSYLKYYIRPGKMISTDFKADKAFVMIDFSYQKDKREYVSDAYVNFTLHYASDCYIDKASFLLVNHEPIILENITTLDRNVSHKFIRVSTILKQEFVDDVLKGIQDSSALLKLELENKELKTFSPTKDLSDRVQEAFSR